MPKSLKALICKSIGLAPMLHPPGYENVAFLNLPINAPAIITVERDFFINSFGISVLFISWLDISILSHFSVTLQPKIRNILIVVFTSSIFGTLYNVTFSLFKRLAAIIGSAAFFEPEIFISPFNFFPPLIINSDISHNNMVFY